MRGLDQGARKIQRYATWRMCSARLWDMIYSLRNGAEVCRPSILRPANERCVVKKTVLVPAAALRCARGANCVSYPTLGEPSKLSRGNPGPRCFACEKQHGDREVDVLAAKLEYAKHRQVKRPSRSKNNEPKVRSEAERSSERATTGRAGVAFVGHQHAEVSHASAIRERRRVSVLTCKRGLQSAIVSGDARLARTWSKSLRDAEDRLRWAESDLEAAEKSA
jgi:hypothetical protein